MVQHMVDSFSKGRFINCGTAMATGDKPQPISVKKTALRDLPNDNRNTILQSPGNSPLLKEKTPVTDATKVSSIQKQQPSCPDSPSCSQPGSNGINGHLVYVRRKLETGSEKVYTNNADPKKHETESEQFGNSDSPALKKSRNDSTDEPMKQSNHMQGTSPASILVPINVPATGPISSSARSTSRNDSTDEPKKQSDHMQGTSPASILVPNVSATAPISSSARSTSPSSNHKPMNGFPVPESNSSRALTGFPVHPEQRKVMAPSPVQPESQTISTCLPFQSERKRPRDQHWKDRFCQLQIFL